MINNENMQKTEKIKTELQKLKNPKQAKILSGFFKTKKGEYGEGDVFLGIKVPKTREVAKKYYKETKLGEVEELLNSKFHEERLCALLILVQKFEDKKLNREEKEKIQKEIFKLYLKNAERINNWDLVDLSAPKIIGKYLFEHREKISVLDELSNSDNLWKQRISILATFYFINKKEFSHTLKLAEKMLSHEHDLMHKAIGWMLREVGKRNQNAEEEFLKKHYKKMPRTMLRYAIEKFSEEKRKSYLNGKI